MLLERIIARGLGKAGRDWNTAVGSTKASKGWNAGILHASEDGQAMYERVAERAYYSRR